MCAVRDGDVDKLGELFEKHHKHLYNFFFRQTGKGQESEDLTQDVFFRMLKYRHTYREDGDFKVWMFKIAYNARNDYYKKLRPVSDIDEYESYLTIGCSTSAWNNTYWLSRIHERAGGER